jgi:hypothetical protein
MSSSSPKAIQARRAREIVDYCKHALVLLQEGPTSHDWVVKWAGAIGLLRTVGDALRKDDEPRIRTAQNKWWKEIEGTKPSPQIFWDFIRRDRNLLLHEAELTAGQSTMVFVQGVSVVALAAGQQPPPESKARPIPKPIHSYHMNSGPFSDRDPRDLVREAIEWWEDQITAIEQDAAKLSP